MIIIEPLSIGWGGWPAVLAQAEAALPPGAPAAPGPLDTASLALATGAVALVLLVAMIALRWLSAQQHRSVNDPRRLVRQLCQAHGFRRSQERLLLKAARALAIAQPARLFIEPQLLAQAAERSSLASRRHELVDMAAELFGPDGETPASE